MKATAFLLALSFAFAACDAASPVDVGPDSAAPDASVGSLSLALTLSDPGAEDAADQVRIRVSGPESRTITAPVGEAIVLENLVPGTYALAVEGLLDSELASFGELEGVRVEPGLGSAATVSMISFVARLDALPTEVALDEPLVVEFTPVAGATGYVVEWDVDPTFPRPASLATGGTSATISAASVGVLYVRVRARSRFDSLGRASALGTVTVLDEWTQVASGSWHSCGLRASGTAYCWGNGEASQLGNGALGALSPEPVSGGPAFASIFVGELHSCGLTAEGRAWCWGAGWGGQLGDGGTVTRATPWEVSSALAFATLSLGGAHTCGLTDEGAAWCWGFGGHGQLGRGGWETATAPVEVSGGLRFADIAAGAWHTCGLTTAGEAWCWGLGSNGQLGDGALANRDVPAKVSGSYTFVDITTVPTITARSYHTCAATTGGDAYCWGAGWGGQLGNGATADQTTPVPVSGGISFAELSAGEGHTCGVDRDGQGWCWGFGGNGQLGNGSTEDRLTPAAVAGGFAFAGISSGGWHACGVSTAGEAWCWGLGSGGVLGTGATADRVVPTRVVDP
jgi:alpha-tubulin suppressor-like RCC1 family protein